MISTNNTYQVDFGGIKLPLFIKYVKTQGMAKTILKINFTNELFIIAPSNRGLFKIYCKSIYKTTSVVIT